MSASIFILTLNEASNIEPCLKWVVMPLVKPLIEISDEVWICADDFVGPNVSVGNRAIVGSFSVVVKNCNAGLIHGGNPAKEIKERLV